VESLEAINPSTGNQLTSYVYGTTLTDSGVAASVLLRSVIYPDSTGVSDQVWIGYNRQAERADLTDQNGTNHLYDYDLLGRLTQDRVGTLGTGIDGAIRRIELAYEVRGLMSRITSSDSPSVGTGNTVNEVMFTYNNFGQSINTYQAHAGAVNLMTTPSVQMGYANGSANTIRPTSLTYPNGRQLSYNYGMSGSIDSSASRVASLIDSDGGSTHLADYSYLGLGSVVQQTSPQADLMFTLANITSGNDPDTGDIYTGLDRFGRVKDIRWRNTASNTDLSRVEYGYDRASNRTWRENPTDPNRNFDWKYGYDGAHRLKNGQRGTLNGTQTEITNPQFGQCWTLDETGNWERFKQANSGAAWTLEQSRTSNEVNEISEIDNTVGAPWAEPAYDAAGNMTTVPKPAEPTDSFAATYDAWNRLVKLTDGEEGPLAQENEYDGCGFRIVTKTYDETETLLETRHAYFTDGWQAVEERLDQSTTPDRQFVWGVRYIDDLVLRDRSVDSGTLNERLYALQDGNWNVTAVADATGTVQERYEYDPYGVASVLAPDFTARGVSDFEWETTYCGYRWDAGTGLFVVRNRFYHPVLGSWLTRDPIGYAAGDVNLLRYVGNSPLDMFDATGQIEFAPKGHHWLPWGVTKNNLNRLTSGGLSVALAYTSGELDHRHNFGEYGGVKHSDYNKYVEAELDKFYKKKGKRYLSGGDVFDFCNLLKDGKGADGKPHKYIGAFNDAIRKHRHAYINVNPARRGFRAPQTAENLRNTGNNLKSHARFKDYLIGLGVLAIFAKSLNTAANVKDVVEHEEFRKGIEALAKGELNTANKHFVGGSNENGVGGVVMIISTKVDVKAGLAFGKYYTDAIDILTSEVEATRSAISSCPTGN